MLPFNVSAMYAQDAAPAPLAPVVAEAAAPGVVSTDSVKASAPVAAEKEKPTAKPAAKADSKKAKPAGKAAKPVTTKTNKPAKTAAKAPAKKPYVKRETYFRLSSFESGKYLDLAEMQDEPVLIAFITTHCPYCRIAMKTLNTINAKYNPKGLHVITVAFEQSPELVAEFVKSTGMTFPAALGDEAVGAAYRIRGVPQFYLLDRDHKVANMWMGLSPKFEQEVSSDVEEVLAEKPSDSTEKAK